MSVHKVILFYCDGPERKCPYSGDSFNGSDPCGSVAEARREMRDLGWQRRKVGDTVLDLCRTCRQMKDEELIDG